MMETATMNLKLGTTVATAGVSLKIKKDADFAVFVYESLQRHRQCDFGDLGEEDKELNSQAMQGEPEKQQRVVSRYNRVSQTGSTDIYIITEWDRSSTTILFPSEY